MRTAYTPEAYAYKEYLQDKGWNVELNFNECISHDNDIVIMFMGVDPYFKKNRFKKIVHDYPSLSVGRLNKYRDRVKKYINRKPDGRIFLNKFVQGGLDYKDGISSIYRDMGVDQGFFDIKEKKHEYDLVYSGSIDGREGLIIELSRLATLGFSILIIGEVNEDIRKYFKLNKNVVFTGRVERNELPDLYRLAKAGLNYTPNIYPFNCQTSTKTLEYLATGIGLVSNHNSWIDQFSMHNKYKPLWIDDITCKEDFDCTSFTELNVLDYNWNSILKKSGINSFLESILSK
jgi:hypothetical protein